MRYHWEHETFLHPERYTLSMGLLEDEDFYDPHGGGDPEVDAIESGRDDPNYSGGGGGGGGGQMSQDPSKWPPGLLQLIRPDLYARIYPDGHPQYPDDPINEVGPQVIENPDGSVTTIGVDGSVETVEPDGRVTIVDSEGTITVREPGPFGPETIGSTTTTYPDGSTLVEDNYGNKTFTDDTSTTNYRSDGSNDTTFSDGSTRDVDTGGNAVYHDADGQFVEAVGGHTADQYGLTYDEKSGRWGKVIPEGSTQDWLGNQIGGDLYNPFQPWEPNPETGEWEPHSGPGDPSDVGDVTGGGPGGTESDEEGTGDQVGDPSGGGAGGQSADEIMAGIAKDIWGRSKEQLETLQPQWQRALDPNYDPRDTQEFGGLFTDIGRSYDREFGKTEQGIIDRTKMGAAQDYTLGEAKKQSARDQQFQENTLANDIATRMRGEAYAVASGKPGEVMAGLAPLSSAQGVGDRAATQRMTDLYNSLGTAISDSSGFGGDK